MFFPLEVWAIPAVARKARWARAGAILMAAFAGVVLYFTFNSAPLAIVVGLACWMMFTRVASVLALKSACDLLQTHAGRLCRTCLYPLDRSMTVCPECGQPGTANSSRWAWARTGLWWPRGTISDLMKADEEGREQSLRAGPATGARGEGLF
ncbi:MAG: hypothetical protein U0573_08480 [Phycisphaerales bacterium]|nr:hypothetical protein [Planctomycetota bacterium]